MTQPVRPLHGETARRQVQKVKLALADRAPKTVNNGLTRLRILLRKAVEWDQLDKLPCTIKLLPNPVRRGWMWCRRQHLRPAAVIMLRIENS